MLGPLLQDRTWTSLAPPSRLRYNRTFPGAVVRIDVIYGLTLAVGDEPVPAVPPSAQEQVLRYPDPHDPAGGATFLGVVLASLIDDATGLDVTAFDAINGVIDDESAQIAMFDEWLANSPEGQALHEQGHGVRPAVLLVSVAPATPVGQR